MANLLKKKGRYYLQFYDQSCRVQRKTISLKTSNKAAALTLKAYHEAEYALGKWSPWESPQNALRSAKADSLQPDSPTVTKALEALKVLNTYMRLLGMIQPEVSRTID